MKTLLKISKDYYSNLAHDYFTEDINHLVNELNVFCEVKNNRYNNIVEDQKRYSSDKEDYKNSIEIESIGYSQGDWQNYILYYNEEEIKTSQEKSYFEDLKKQLKRSFTHFNDYYCELFEITEIDGKKFTSDAYDITSLVIDHIEFPEDEDIIEAHNSIYGKNYDEVVIVNN